MVLTKKDMEKLEEVFATKSEIAKLFKNVVRTGDIHDVVRKGDLHDVVKKSDLLHHFDVVMIKMEDISLEQKMSFGQYRRQEETLIDHEQRIKVLETTR